MKTSHLILIGLGLVLFYFIWQAYQTLVSAGQGAASIETAIANGIRNLFAAVGLGNNQPQTAQQQIATATDDYSANGPVNLMGGSDPTGGTPIVNPYLTQ